MSLLIFKFPVVITIVSKLGRCTLDNSYSDNAIKFNFRNCKRKVQMHYQQKILPHLQNYKHHCGVKILKYDIKRNKKHFTDYNLFLFQ